MAENRINVDVDVILDLTANLARRVSSLEKQLQDTQGNVERQAEDLENMRHGGEESYRETVSYLASLSNNIESLTDDIVTLDERTQSPKEVDALDFNDFIALVAEKVAHKLLAGARR